MFGRLGDSKYQSQCKECFYNYRRHRRQGQRNSVLEKLGGACADCGYDENLLGLEIDHVEGGGRAHRNQWKDRGQYYSELNRLLDDGYSGLQILCGTCHRIKTQRENGWE